MFEIQNVFSITPTSNDNELRARSFPNFSSSDLLGGHSRGMFGTLGLNCDGTRHRKPVCRSEGLGLRGPMQQDGSGGNGPQTRLPDLGHAAEMQAAVAQLPHTASGVRSCRDSRQRAGDFRHTQPNSISGTKPKHRTFPVIERFVSERLLSKLCAVIEI